MRASRARFRGGLVGCLVLIAAIFSGCLTSEEAILGRYDAAKDEFVFLNLYQRITAEKPADLEYLYALWQNRDHLITPPLPTIFTKSSVLRLSPAEYVAVNLGESPKEIAPSPSPIPLDAITVKPGKFFARGDNTLCYYDQIVVPGKVVDQALEEASKAMRTSVSGAIAAERDRRKNGGKVWTWNDFQKLRLRDLRGEDASNANPADQPPEELLPYVSVGTLDMLAKGLTEGTAAVSRKGSVFTVVIPAAEPDVAGTLSVVKAMRTEADALIAKGTATKSLTTAKKLSDPIEVRAASPTLLEMKIDVTRLFEAMQAVQPAAAPLEPANEETAKRAADAVSAMKAKGVPIDTELTVDQILSRFKDGSLPANPSAKPVKPGEGMVIAVKEEAK